MTSPFDNSDFPHEVEDRTEEPRSPEAPNPSARHRDHRDPANESPGFVGFIYLQRDNPDGTPAKNTAESRRKLEATAHHAKKIAKQLGLDAKTSPQAASNGKLDRQRSTRNRKASNPAMAKRADQLVAQIAAVREETPDGAKRTGIYVAVTRDALNVLQRAVVGIMKFLNDKLSARFMGRFKISNGKWNVEADMEMEIGSPKKK
jgi:hypothetical protein